VQARGPDLLTQVGGHEDELLKLVLYIFVGLEPVRTYAVLDVRCSVVGASFDLPSRIFYRERQRT
jgi:hypothetical protein